MCRVAVIASALVAALACAGCSRGGEERPAHVRRVGRTLALDRASAAFVRVEPAVAASAASTRLLSARVGFDERRVARLGPPVPGRVASVKVVPGDVVKRGDVLLTVHAPDMAAARAQVASARAARLLAERNAARATMLVRDGAGSEAERQQAETALAQARTEEARALAALSAVGGAVGASDYAVRAPFDGTVVERNVGVGSAVHVDQDKPLAVVADMSSVWILADVYERDLGSVKLGEEAQIEVFALPGRRFVGTFSDVGRVLDPATRAVTARVELPNPDGALKAGMLARVVAHGGPAGGVEVPSSAVLARRDQFFVFVERDDGRFIEREVHVGEQHGQHTILLDGVAPGEKVVTEGAILLDTEANEAL
jgi:cobalt-zinc-cadmium efflux system membrane fusion protein